MDSLRLSDADRESAVDLLGEQYSVGRLTKDEFDERSDAVWSARTHGDLASVFADLPVRSLAASGHTGRRPPGGGRRFPAWLASVRVPLAPLLFVLVALTILTHLPVVLLAVGLWFLLGRRNWHGHRWHGHRGRDWQPGT